MGFDGVSFRVELEETPLRHLDGYGDRRIFSGWASVRGIDFEDMEILPEAFRAGAQAYLTKNPVLLWDHARYLPIGKVLEIAFDDAGIYIVAEIFNLTAEGKDANGKKPIEMPKDSRYPELQSIAAKCDEVWGLVVSGKVRGLSVSGRVRGKMQTFTDENGNKVKRPPEVLIYEISVTPIQVVPKAKIDAANTLAKALRIVKGLSFGPKIAPSSRRYVLRPPTQEQKTCRIDTKSLRKC